MADVLPNVEGDNGQIKESTPVIMINPDGSLAAPNALVEATRSDRAYLASTGPIAVTIGQRLHAILSNPSDSGVNVFLYNRLFGNDIAASGDNLEYVAYGNPTATLANSAAGFNADIGQAGSNSIFSFEAAPSITMGGFTGTGETLPRGDTYSRDLLAIMRPGVSLGFTIQGDGNNLVQAARLSITLEWYEELVN
jgi:hypothetical protein